MSGEKRIPAGQPISAHIAVSQSPQWRSAREALTIIDSVHGDGMLPQIEVVIGTDGPGSYVYSGRDGRPLRIELKPVGGPNPQLTFVQEIGHFLDHQALGTRNKFASANGEIATLMAAIGTSDAIRRLAQRRGKRTALVETRPGRRQRETVAQRTVAYLLAPEEQFGRAYAQYIAMCSGDVTMLQQVDRIRSNPFRQGIYYEYWSDADFTPVGEAFDALFREQGWIE